MKLLFDIEATQPHKSGKRHGGGRYGEVVFKRIVERHLPVCVYYDSHNWLNPEIKEIIDNFGITCFDRQSGSIDSIIKENQIDSFYTPVISDSKISVTASPVKATIHGMRSLELGYDSFMWKYKSASWKEKAKFLVKRFFPSWGYKNAYAKFAKVANSQNISFAMVSNHSVNTLQAYCPQFKDKGIKVFYSPSTSSEKDRLTKYTDKYFLLVSANRWEKNALRPIIALDRLFSAGFYPDHKVRITGVKGPVYNYTIQNKDRFEFCGYVDDDELEQLYHDAFGFIYMSLNEGFGYPPLEAMHYGVPCVVSPFTSISEVCGGAALYANPYSIEEIMARILMLQDPDRYQEISNLSKERYVKITQKQKSDLDGVIDFIYNLKQKEG